MKDTRMRYLMFRQNTLGNSDLFVNTIDRIIRRYVENKADF